VIADTRYTTTLDGFRIAYQVLGEGPVDLAYVPAFASHLEHSWECRPYAEFLRRLSTFSRLIMIDRRGTGLSDPISGDALPTLETRMGDLTAVLDTVGSERTAFLGVMEGGSTCALDRKGGGDGATTRTILACTDPQDPPQQLSRASARAPGASG